MNDQSINLSYCLHHYEHNITTPGEPVVMAAGVMSFSMKLLASSVNGMQK